MSPPKGGSGPPKGTAAAITMTDQPKHHQGPAGVDDSRDKLKFDQRPPWLKWSPLTPIEREVYTVLYSFDWMVDGSRPPIPMVAKMTGLKRTAVKGAIRRLRQIGVLDVEERLDGKVHLPNGYSFPDPPESFLAACWKLAEECGVGRPGDLRGSSTRPTPGSSRRPRVGRHGDPEVDRESTHTQADIPSSPSVPAAPVGGAKDGQGATQGGGASKVDRYKKPLTDPALEEQCQLLADYAIEWMHIPERRREHEVESSRWLLDYDHLDPAEVHKVILRTRSDGRWQWVPNLYVLRENYGGILGHITSGKEPLPMKRTKPKAPKDKGPGDQRNNGEPVKATACTLKDL